jgi:hypothetical protein
MSRRSQRSANDSSPRPLPSEGDRMAITMDRRAPVRIAGVLSRRPSASCSLVPALQLLCVTGAHAAVWPFTCTKSFAKPVLPASSAVFILPRRLSAAGKLSIQRDSFNGETSYALLRGRVTRCSSFRFGASRETKSSPTAVFQVQRNVVPHGARCVYATASGEKTD